MPTKKARKPQPCSKPCTKTVKFMTDREIGPNIGISLPPYKKVSGYSFLNVSVRFTQDEHDEPPVDLGVMFAFDSHGKMGARRYVNFEENVPGPQSTNFIEVSGAGSWHGNQWKTSSYMARFPIMGPYAQVFVYNRAPVARTVSVWGFLVG